MTLRHSEFRRLFISEEMADISNMGKHSLCHQQTCFNIVTVFFIGSANDYTHVFGSQQSTGVLTPYIAECFSRYFRN